MQKKKPLPHQVEAIKAVVKEFKTADRTHIVMACGTGKTFTALKIAEKMKPKSMIIFLPSLALISQFMKEWMAQTDLCDLKMLTICSDDTVTNGMESESLLCEDIDFPVSNDISDISSFLAKKTDNIKLIFCTYQSSYLLQDTHFDLAIFDEAHRTAGYEKDKFSFALSDSNVNISKRLFMTATPRHSHAIKRDKDGDPVTLFSMDNELIYGRRCYTMGFREAINLGLICDYKIVISISKLDNGDTESVSAKAVALKRAVERSKSNKIITYHRCINDASEFCLFMNHHKLLKDHLSLSINGRLPMKSRSEIMEKFRGEKKSIISNSRCLTEGIDVPSIDMVAFLNPRSSKIDIVQAIGRALRNNKGKKLGYIFLPIFINTSNPDIEEEVSKSKFHHIWEVLTALSEQDSDLNDIIKNISSKKGATGAHDYNELSRFIDTDIDLNYLSSIQAKILKAFSSGWNESYRKLLEYKNTYGHTRVPYDIKNRGGEHKTLAHWVRQQRDYKKNKFLSKERQDLLNNIGFDWDPGDALWQENYAVALEFYKENGHTRIPHNKKLPGKILRLSKWINAQRRRVNLRTMPEDRIELLKKIDFDFSEICSQQDWFTSGYPRLVEYVRKNGKKYTKLGGIDVTGSVYLKGFIGVARKKYRDGEISDEQIRLLERIDIVWDPEDHTWNKTFDLYSEKLKNKKSLDGLGSWTRVQRTNYKKQKSNRERQ